MKLGVNIDHVATLRQARYNGMLDSYNCEPSVLEAALVCERAGASGITVHLRADRRHIQDRDVFELKERIATRLNLEMGNTPEIVGIALKVVPYEVCIVPENRQEITTEGGLDAVGQRRELKPTIERLQGAGIRVSLFIEPDPNQIDAAKELGAEMVELHTGAFANAEPTKYRAELERIRTAAEFAHSRGLQVNAGHGINYMNVLDIRRVPQLEVLNIGHSIVSRSMYVGLSAAVNEMVRLLNVPERPPGASWIPD